MAGGAKLEAAHLQDLAAALAGGIQADALKGALSLHSPVRRGWVVVPASPSGFTIITLAGTVITDIDE